MAALISLDTAKAHLGVTGTDDDALVTNKTDEATAIILDYLAPRNKAADGSDWTEATLPKVVQSAIEIMLTHLYEHRGDDMQPDEAVWKAIERLLMRSRDPALA